ncbi:SPT2 chromatin protein [Actinidia rufa]|uniref:SPT2 chromatin protein n=1 Tax=Actinidia rufa TaxID=165716 RepID=A0A7J0EK91_9ERIC|nr:SPT2 chromatin protein [Actinidia rufa]
MAMRRYGRDDYEDLDEYEEDGEEAEEEGVGEEEYEEEEEEAPQPTQEELEYLELRQRLKDSFRKQMKKESGSAVANTHDKKKKLPYDKFLTPCNIATGRLSFGSFFGPSQPVIAQRVIQESKSLLENQHLTAKKNKSVASTTTRSKPQVHDHRPKVVNELKTKAQKLKDTRDYSFLLSDDVELPAPTKDPPPRNISLPISDARSAQTLPKGKQSLTNPVRQLPNGHKDRKPVSKGSQMHPKVGSHKLASASKPVLASVEYRKQIGNNNGSGPGRSLGAKGLPSKKPAATTERSVPTAAAKSSLLSAHKPPPSKFLSAASKPPPVLKQPLNQKKEFQESSKGKMLPKQPAVACKPQIKKPPAKSLSRPTLQENRPKKKPVRRYSDDEDEDGGRAISMIRQMFRYNPNKYAGRDDDDSDMEANFDDILKEEKRRFMCYL